MIFTAQRKDLLAQVKRVSKATPRKSMLPILSGIHVEAVPELAALRLMATDFEVAIRTSIRAKVKSGGEFVMDARLLTGLLGKLSGDEVTMELQANNSVRVRSGNADFILGVLNGAEFPRIEIPTPNATVMVTGIPSLIGATAFAASKEAPGQAARPQLSCVNLIIGDNGIRAVATDGISLAETRGDPDCVGNFSMMLTASSLNTLASLASESDVFELGITGEGSGKTASFYDGTMLFTARLINATPMDTDAIISNVKPKIYVAVDANALKTAVASVATLVSNKEQLELVVGDGEMRLSCKSSDGTATSAIAARTSVSSEQVFCFALGRFAECVRTLQGEAIIGFNTEKSPMLLECGKTRYLQIPVRRTVKEIAVDTKPKKAKAAKKPEAAEAA